MTLLLNFLQNFHFLGKETKKSIQRVFLCQKNAKDKAREVFWVRLTYLVAEIKKQSSLKPIRKQKSLYHKVG